MSPSSTFRSALHVSPQRLARLSDTELNELMRQLLHLQAYRCGCPGPTVNTEVKAPDDGCDGWSERPAKEDRWLGNTATCWQFKAGIAGQPGRLIGEVEKARPRRTLQDDGRFVVVASGSTGGKPGTDHRRQKLVDAARQAGLPAENIEVYGSENLAEWCNQYPAIAARWAGRSEGLSTWDDWAQSGEHRVPYQPSPKIESALTERRRQLDFDTVSESEAVHHLHVEGHPGVGKTRFALELCRSAPWRDTVIYVRQAEDVRLTELIDSVTSEPDVRMVVVADEAQPERLEPLRDSVERAAGRVRLVTIGSCPTPDPRRISPVTVEPLDAAAMRQVVRGWHPDMPLEHVDFVTRFADGYMRLARLTADAVADAPEATVPNLLERHEIQVFLKRLLGDGDHRALYVVAVLTQTGWSDDKQQEGQAIAEHLGLNWSDVRYDVEQFDRRMGIARRGGRYRYISPNPLGIYLAHEAWATYPDLLKSLPSILPSESAKEAYYRRLESLANNPAVSAYSRDQLRFFFRIDDFVDVHAARRWSAFSAADPELAVHQLSHALSNTTLDDRRRIEFGALGEIVHRLARIASRSSGFHDAVTALALLAEAENGTWGTGASREFLAKYLIPSGGTALPYRQRLDTLDELAAQARPALRGLVVRALAQVGSNSAGTIMQPAIAEVPDPDWQPSTTKEYLECIAAAVSRLQTIAAGRDPALQPDLLAAAEDMSWLLPYHDAGARVARFLVSLHQAYPETREPLRQQVAEVIRSQETLPPDQRRVLDRLHAEFEDRSLEGRLLQHVGPTRWDLEASPESPEIASLGVELAVAPNLLEEHLSWLTSGEASQSWELGEALAAADPDGRLAEVLANHANGGPDLRIVGGYIAVRRKTLGDEWYERWVTAQFEREPRPLVLLLEVVRSCGPTDRLTACVAELLRGRSLNAAQVGRLKYTNWSGTSDSALHTLLRVMADTGHRETAIGILQHRIRQAGGGIGRWKPLALTLATDPHLIRCQGMANHYWQKVAEPLAADHPHELAAAIFRAHAQHDKPDIWLLRHKQAVKVLNACVERAPLDVWEALRLHLWPLEDALLFVIGFPSGVVDRLPADAVVAWIAEPPAAQAVQRAALVARLTNKSLLTDQSLAARILAKYGGDEMVDEAFFGHQISGASSGLLSSRWEELRQGLEAVASSTKLPRMRAWARKSTAALREMIDRERQHEEEHALLLR